MKKRIQSVVAVSLACCLLLDPAWADPFTLRDSGAIPVASRDLEATLNAQALAAASAAAFVRLQPVVSSRLFRAAAFALGLWLAHRAGWIPGAMDWAAIPGGLLFPGRPPRNDSAVAKLTNLKSAIEPHRTKPGFFKPAELAIIDGINQGWSASRIALELVMDRENVRQHAEVILRKIGGENILEEQRKPVRERSVHSLTNLPANVHRILEDNGIQSIGQVVALSGPDIRALRPSAASGLKTGIGKTGLASLVTALAEVGERLGSVTLYSIGEPAAWLAMFRQYGTFYALTVAWGLASIWWVGFSVIVPLAAFLVAYRTRGLNRKVARSTKALLPFMEGKDHSELFAFVQTHLSAWIPASILKEALLLHVDYHPDTAPKVHPLTERTLPLDEGNVITYLHEHKRYAEAWWLHPSGAPHDPFADDYAFDQIFQKPSALPRTSRPVILSIDFDAFGSIEEGPLPWAEVSGRIDDFLAALERKNYDVIAIFTTASPRWLGGYADEIRERLYAGLEKLYSFRHDGGGGDDSGEANHGNTPEARLDYPPQRGLLRAA